MQLYPVEGGGNKILSNTMQHQTKTASILIKRNVFIFKILQIYVAT